MDIIVRYFYNGQVPSKLSVWPKYNHYCADKKYEEIASLLGLKFKTTKQAVEALADAVIKLCKDCDLDPNLSAMGIDKNELEKNIEDIAVAAYEDQCSPANPRVPLVEDMVEIIRKAYSGN